MFFHHESLKVETQAGTITFRPLILSDIKKVVSFVEQNVEIFKEFFPITIKRVLGSKAEQREWIAEKTDLALPPKSLIYIGISDITGQILYMGSAFNFEWRVPKCEIAWMIDVTIFGKGVATQCTSLMIDKIMKTMDLEKIVCRISPQNTASTKLAARLGFVLEGIHLKDFRNGNGDLIDVGYWGKWR